MLISVMGAFNVFANAETANLLVLALRTILVEVDFLVDKLHVASLDYELLRLCVIGIELVKELLLDLLVPLVLLEEGEAEIRREIAKIAHVKLYIVSDACANIHPRDHPHELLKNYVYGYVIYRH